MENIEEPTLAEQQEPKLVVTEAMRSYFYDMAKWANFLAVVGFVFTGFIVIGAFTVGSTINSNPEMAKMLGPLGAMGSLAFTAICLVYAFAIFYPSILFFKYSTQAKIGVLYGEQASLEEAFGKLKSLFKYWGVVMIIFISLYLVMVFSTVMGAS